MNAWTYPVTPILRHVDNYHGVPIADPYRWLEDDATPQRHAWIAAQNRVTEAHLATTPTRHELRRRFRQLLNYTRYYDVARRGAYLVFKANTGLRDQPLLYVQQGLTAPPEVLVDPTALATDSTTRITSVALSKDTKYLAYGLSYGGSDWHEYRVKSMVTRRDLPDRLRWVRASAIAWHGDGFYYSRYSAPQADVGGASARAENHQVWYHVVGTPQTDDRLVYEDPDRPLRVHFVHTTSDERFAIMGILDRAAQAPGNALWIRDLSIAGADWVPLVESFDDHCQVIANDDRGLVLLTTRHATNGRLVRIDPARLGETEIQDLIPEGSEPLEVVTAAGGRLFALYRMGTAHRVSVFDESGSLYDQLALPGVGTVRLWPGQPEDREMLWSFASFTVPPTTFRYDIQKRASSVLWAPTMPTDPADYETKRVMCTSRDGTQIPMWIVHKAGLLRDGRNPSLLEGYGGHGVSMGPTFDPFLIALLERGVVVAQASLRGGGEYGERWHHAGWRQNKQNVFDDCIAAAEWLQDNGYTSRTRLALSGASNGGLLVGAVMTQRPDLFAVALPSAGLMDMLRFQNFTMGWLWIAEYGSSDDPAMFPILRSYSPVHNVRSGVAYPATLVTTSEHDDRVVAAHSFKFIAELQGKGTPVRPYLIRIDPRSGHGPASLSRAIEERADTYAFMLRHTTETIAAHGSPSAVAAESLAPARARAELPVATGSEHDG